MKRLIVLFILISALAGFHPIPSKAADSTTLTDEQIETIIATIQDDQRQLREMNKKDSDLKTGDFAAFVGDWPFVMYYATWVTSLGYPDLGDNMIQGWYREHQRLLKNIGDQVNTLAEADLTDDQLQTYGKQLESTISGLEDILDQASTDFINGITGGAFNKLQGNAKDDTITAMKTFQNWMKNANSIAKNGVGEFLRGKMIDSVTSAITDTIKQYAAHKVLDEALGQSDDPDINQMKDDLSNAMFETNPLKRAIASEKAMNDAFKVIDNAIGMNSVPPNFPTIITDYSSNSEIYTSKYYENVLQKATELSGNDPAVYMAQLSELYIAQDIPDAVRIEVFAAMKKAGIDPLSLPPAVNSIKAVPAGYNKIQLSWAASTGASGYEIYRSTTSGNYSKIATITNSNTISFTDSGLTTGQTYFYKIRAYRIDNGSTIYSSYSGLVSDTPVLEVPGRLKTAKSGYSSIKISWNQSSEATGYELYRSTSVSGTYSKAATITNTSAVSFTDNGLTTGKTYFYKIRAYRINNGSTIYSSYSGIVSDIPTLAVSSNIKAARVSSSSIKVSWNKSIEATGYELYRSTSASGTFSKATNITNANTVSYTDSGLTTGKTYYYKIRAYRIVGNSKVYSPYSMIVNGKPTLSIPDSLNAAKASSVSIKVSWSIASDASGYELYQATSKNGSYQKIGTLTKNSVTSFTNTKLTKGRTYYYKLRSYRVVNKQNIYSDFTAVTYVKL